MFYGSRGLCKWFIEYDKDRRNGDDVDECLNLKFCAIE